MHGQEGADWGDVPDAPGEPQDVGDTFGRLPTDNWGEPVVLQVFPEGQPIVNGSDGHHRLLKSHSPGCALVQKHIHTIVL
jgi:hypothetical protein